MTQLHIKSGTAVLTADGLRCRALGKSNPSQVCNKLLVKRNSLNQLAGAFRCERCGADIEVEVRP